MSANVLVADDEEGIRFYLSQLLGKEGCTVKEAADGAEAVRMAEREHFDVIILDIKMPHLDGLQALTQIQKIRPNTPVLIITAHGSPEIGRKAIEAGAYDYFTKPVENAELRIVIKRAVERGTLVNQVAELQRKVKRLRGPKELIGDSDAMNEVRQMIGRVADSDVTVLILGESGTGKELVANAIVEGSPRRGEPFIKVNCAAIPENLLESELFGHERGAFTGAVVTKPGKFELADQGTIFLDEIGALPASLQPKLLRVLQEREFERVGGTKPKRVNVRVIAATNANLKQQVERRAFREDLYYRLNVVPVVLPPLRERPGDLKVLVDRFLTLFSEQFKKQINEVSNEVMELFLSYEWPGNVRELENVIQRACILTPDRSSEITIQSLPPEMRTSTIDLKTMAEQIDRTVAPTEEWLEDFSIPLAEKIETVAAGVEKKLIQRALKNSGERRQAAADLLGISRKSLHNKMVKYGLRDEKNG